MSKFRRGGMVRHTVRLGAWGVGLMAAQGAAANDIPWNPPVGGSTGWNDGANWGGTPPANDTTTDIAHFNSTAYNFQPVLDANTLQSVNGLRFGDGATAAAALTINTTSSAAAGQVTSGSTANGSSTITLVDASTTVVGQRVTGTRIPVGTYVTAVNGNEITLSQPTAGGTLNNGTQLTFASSLQIGTGGVTVESGVDGVQNIAAPVVLGGSQTWTNNATQGSALTISGGVYLGSHTLTLSGVTGSSTLIPNSGGLSGAGALVIDTAGEVRFGAGTGGRPNNPFSGGVTLNAGRLTISGGNSGGGGGSPSLGTGVLTINGGEINGAGNIAGHPLTISGQVWNADWTFINSKRLEMGDGAISLGTAPGTARKVTVNAGSTYLDIDGAISDGTTANSLIKAGGGLLSLGGMNTYTGDTTVEDGTLTLADGGGLTFVIGGDGVNNQVIGDGTLNLDGAFTFDLTGASTSLGDAWDIVSVGTLTETFGSTFSVTGFSETDDVWTLAINPSLLYAFSESTGTLSVIAVPEPASVALLAIGSLMALPRRTR